tara:strand:+ start:494 stop:1363 length:870 start_codon:yes stop_codon:yes gene_type:complete
MAEEDTNDPIGGGVGQTAGVGSSLSPYVGEYGTDMLGEGWAASDLPYEAYTGPLTAGSSELQEQQFEGLAGLTIPTEGMTAFTGSMADPSSVASYMNPYLQNVLNPQIADLKREADIARVADASRLTKAGAYGGSRQAVLDALTNENLLRQLDKTIGTGYSTAYDKAQDAMKFDRETQEGERQYGLAALDRMGSAGETQRAIDAEGIAADKEQFEEERDWVYKMPTYLQSLLQELPLESQDYSFVTPSGTSQGLMGMSDVLQLLANFAGMAPPPTTPVKTEEKEEEGKA